MVIYIYVYIYKILINNKLLFVKKIYVYIVFTNEDVTGSLPKGIVRNSSLLNTNLLLKYG